MCVCVCARVSDIFPPAHVPGIFRTKTHVVFAKSTSQIGQLPFVFSTCITPFFNQSAPSARSGLNLDQPVSLLRTVLLVHQHESHRRLTSFSHCIRLQRNVIMELGPNNTTSALYMCCSWVCTAAVSSKHDWENRLFILSWSEEATVALVVKNDCRK